MPRSQTAATHGAGCSVKWWRALAAAAPHCVQYPSSATSPPHSWHAAAVARGTTTGVGAWASGGSAATAAGCGPRSAPQASQNRSPVATGLRHDGQSSAAPATPITPAPPTGSATGGATASSPDSEVIATTSDAPVLLRSEGYVGHGARAVSRTVALTVDTLAFLAAHTGLAL